LDAGSVVVIRSRDSESATEIVVACDMGWG
jgi:hypothetical protein